MKPLTEQQIIGKKGERIAVRYLRREGFRIVAKNRHFGRNELDIIAKNKHYIVFVEVKTRSFVSPEHAEGRPSDAVGRAKRRRTVEAAREYLRSHPTKRCPRLDVIEIYLDRSKGNKPYKINHIPAAFSATGEIL